MEKLNLDICSSLNNSINNVLDKPSKEIGTSIGTILEFFNNTFLYPLKKYNIYAERKIAQFKEELTEKMLKIPKEDLVEPSMNIFGPTLEALKYNLDEKYIKEMFTNILLADINKNTKDMLMPAYIEIIKQLSSKDARIISTILGVDDTKCYSFYEMKHYKKGKTKAFSTTGIFVLEPNNCRDCIFIPEICLNNLKRLGLIELKLYKERIKNDFVKLLSTSLVESGINVPDEGYEYDGDLYVLSFTKFAKNFINLCMDKEYFVDEDYIGHFCKVKE